MPAQAEMPDMLPDMYASLGVSRSATNTEIRRAYRNLITKVRRNHPSTTRPPVPSPI
jgi:DnaJ-class molecular chaperone